MYLTDEEGSGILAIKKPANVFCFCFCFAAVVVRVSVVFVCLFFASLSFSAYTPKDGTSREGLKKVSMCFSFPTQGLWSYTVVLYNCHYCWS